MTSAKPVLLSVEGITKAYPGVVANADVSFQIHQGEVHALLGENGAGKSTLVKMIYGLVKPDQGRMTWRGASYAPSEPRAARAAGVAMVFQHFSLFEALNVAENVALGIVLGLALAHVAVAWIDASMGIELGFIAEHPRMTCRGLSVVIGDDGYPSRCGGDSK